MKIVVLIATHNNAYILQNTLANLDTLRPQPDKYIFYENNSPDETIDVLAFWKKRYPTEIIRQWYRRDSVKILGNPYSIIALARQYLLKRARQIDTDYAIFLDDDIGVLDINFLDKITSWEKDIVGGLYLRKYPRGLFYGTIWKLDPDKGYKFSNKIVTEFQEVLATSTGCLCLSRKIIQDRRLNFLPLPENSSEDYGYCLNARKLGYKVYVDPSIRLNHYYKRYNYKPWVVDPKKKYDPADIPYVDFRYPE